MNKCAKCGKALKENSQVTIIMSIAGAIENNHTPVDQIYDALDADQIDIELYCEACKNGEKTDELTCRERYNKFAAELTCAGCKACEEIKDCEDLWHQVCASCPLHQSTPTGSCANMDESATSL